MSDVQPPVPAPQPPANQPPVAAPVVPGKTLGIVALIVAFFFSLLGLILGLVARSQSKRAGVKNTPATIAIVLSIIFMVLGIIGGIVWASAIGSLFNACAQLGPGVHEVGGVTYTCG